MISSGHRRGVRNLFDIVSLLQYAFSRWDGPNCTDIGGLVYHALNRANAQMTLFESDADYEAFETVVAAAVERVSMRLLAYRVMPNHWHLVLHPRKDATCRGS